MGRRMQIAVFGAVVVGSMGGGLAAWVLSSRSLAHLPVAQPAPPQQPSAGPAVAEPMVPGQPSPPPRDPDTVLALQLKTVLARFAAWSRDHAGAPCPDGTMLGIVTLDPWGHPIELTCTDQPADQMVGAISAGPDGIAGNADDVTSWALGREVTDLVRGARWSSTPAATAAPLTAKPPAVKRSKGHAGTHDHGPAPATIPSALPNGAGSDDIPARR